MGLLKPRRRRSRPLRSYTTLKCLVAGHQVTLVEQGRLKALLMSRNPSKRFTSSTGHGRGTYRPQTSVGCLIVTATDGADDPTLRQELIEACADEGLEFGIRIASLGRIGGGDKGRNALAGGHVVLGAQVAKAAGEFHHQPHLILGLVV